MCEEEFRPPLRITVCVVATKRNTTPSEAPAEDMSRITSIRLGQAQYEALRTLAFQERRSVSAQLRHIVDEALAEQKAA